MPEPKLSVAEFSAKVKLKYPQYKDVDDSLLVSKMLDKYPVYSEQVDFDVKKKEPSEASALQSLAEPSASATSTEVPAAFGEIPKFEGTKDKEPAKTRQQVIEEQRNEQAKKFLDLGSYIGSSIAEGVVSANTYLNRSIETLLLGNNTNYFSSNSAKLLEPLNKEKERLQSEYVGEQSIGKGVVENFQEDPLTGAKLLAFEAGRQIPQMYAMGAIGRALMPAEGVAAAGLRTGSILAPRTKLVKKITEDVAPMVPLGMSAAGQAYLDAAEKNPEDDFIDAIANLAIATYKGTSEVASELLFRTSVDDLIRGGFRKGLVSDIAKSTRPTLQAAKQVGRDVAVEGFQEGLEELAVEISSNAIDALVFGEDMLAEKNIYGMADSFILGSAIGSPITLLSKGPSAIGTANNINKRRKISEEVNDLYDVHQDPTTSASEKAIVKGQIINKLAELKQVENGLASFYEEFSEEDRDNVISLNQQLSMAQLIYPELKDEQSKDIIQEKVKEIYSEKTKIESKYDPNIKVYEYDTQKEAGVPSPVVEGEAPIEVQPIQVASGTSPEADRVLQVLEQQEVFQKIAEAQEVDNTEAQAAQQQILNAIDEVDALDIADDVKTAYIQTLEDKFDDIEYYDNKTITTTEQVTEEVPVGAPRAGSRTIVEPEVRRGKFRLFERLNNLEVAVGTETEGQTSVIETQEDGSIDVVTYDKKTKQEVSRQPKVAENILGLEYVESILDADGNLTGVVMRPKTPKGEDISPVRIQVVNRPELALDIAIDARKKEIGDVPEVIWMQEYETVTREVTTKEQVPAAKRPERKAARVVLPTEAVAAEQVTEEVVEQEPTKNKKGLTSEQVTEAVSAAKRLSKRLGLPTKIIAHNSRKEFNDAMDEVSKSGSVASGVESGRFIPSRNEIHLNLEDMTSEVPFHEVFHAAFVNRFGKRGQKIREKVATDFYNGIVRILRSGSEQDQLLADAVESFTKSGYYTAEETPEEFLAQTAGFLSTSGDKISKSTMDKLIQWLNNFIAKIAPGVKINTRGEFIDFMNSFSGALFESSIDDQTYTGLESEVTTSIPPVSESSSRQGRDASYVDRTFDKEKIQFADLSEYVGKPAITYAMDLAVTGTVKSPTGVTYTFDGGVFYPLLGEGGWAFTDEKTARKILSKLKKFDGRVLLMSQDSRGIRGNFQFWGYMLDEVNKAVKDKRATEAELVEYINSKLKKKPIQLALAEKGLPLQIKKLSELNGLMPNDGPKKVGYEVRAEFNEALFSAEANKRFGLPRIEAILDYVNEPLLANAQYGDLVAVLEFDPAKMDVKDSRKIKDAKVHPAYPWIITGFKDLKILNEFVDVRNVFGDYRSKMAEEKGDPELKKRIKIRAARAVVTGGASVNNLEINDNIVKSILGIAPYRAKYVNDISEARDEYKKPSFERFINAFNNIAKKFDVQVYGIEKTIGGWYDSELNSVTQEVSMRPTITGNKEDILAMSAVAGIMAPVKKEDFQNGVMLVEYKSGAKGSEVTFKANSDASAKQIINSLNDYGFGGGFTYVVSDKSFNLALIPDEDISYSQLRDNLDNLLTFAQESNLIDEKSIEYYEAEIKFPNSDRGSESYYGRILQEARDSKRYEKDGREGALKLLNQALEILDERNNAIDSELSESSSRDVREEILDKEQLSFKQRAVNTAKTFVWSDTQKQIRVFKERMSSQLSVEGREIKKFTKGLNQLLKKADLQTIDLVGNIFDGTLTPENQRILESKPNGNLIFGQANAMRNYLDSFSDDFVNSPEFHALPEETVNTIIDNFGQYMRGSYRFWKDKNFKPSNAARRDAIAYEYEILRAKKVNDLINKEGFNEDEAGEFFELLHDETLKEATKAIDDYITEIEKIRNGDDFKKLGIVSPSSIKLPSEQFMRRKELPETIQTLLGKETDPIIRFIDTTIALSNIKYKGHMLYAISESLGGTSFIKNEVTKAELDSKEYREVKDKFSPLNGRFVHKDVYEAITDQKIYDTDIPWLRPYFTMLKLARKSKVIYNLPTWRKNLTGGWYTMAANGVINPNLFKDFKRRAQLFANREVDAETEALIKIMGDNGIIGQDVNANLLGFTNAIYSRALTGNDAEYSTYVKVAKDVIKNFDTIIGQKYSAVDDYTKLVIFRSEIQSFAKKLYSKPYESLTEAQKNKVHAEAAEFVKQNTPTFSRLPKWYASLARIPAGDFLSFEFESLRSFSANIQNGQQDLMKGMNDKTLSKEQKDEYIKSGARRLAGSASILGTRLAITSILASLALGDDDELEEDIKNNRPNWMEGHSIVPTKISKDGIATVYDYSMEDPYGSFFDLATDPLSFPAYLVDLLKPNMGISFAMNLAENKDFYGRDITNSYDDPLTKGYKYTGHTLKSLILPPFIASTLRDEQKRLEVEADKYSPLDGVARFATRAVIRDYEYNIPVQFYYFTDKFRTKKEQYSDLTGASRDNRLAELDEIKKMYKSITNIGIKKGNFKMIADANKNIKRALKPNEEAYVLYGYEIPEKK